MPTYVVQDKEENKGKFKGKGAANRRTPKDILAELKREAAKANNVFLATDPDREGEAIAWHIEERASVWMTRALSALPLMRSRAVRCRTRWLTPAKSTWIAFTPRRRGEFWIASWAIR